MRHLKSGFFALVLLASSCGSDPAAFTSITTESPEGELYLASTDPKAPEWMKSGPVAPLKTTRLNPSMGFAKIKAALEAASPGQEFLLDPGTYLASNRINLSRSGTDAQPIRIRAKDPTQPTVWDGKLSTSARDCFQITGKNYLFEGVKFQNCLQWQSAAIRAVEPNAANILVRGCEFAQMRSALTGTAERYVAENISVHNVWGHGVYIYGGSFELRRSVFQMIGDKSVRLVGGTPSVDEGQNFHVRARTARLEYNWFGSPYSYMGDQMNCEGLCNADGSQKMVLRGNVLVAWDGVRARPKNVHHILAHLDESGSVSKFELVLVGNTVLGYSTRVSNLNLLNLGDRETNILRLESNVLVDVGSVYDTPGRVNISGTGNWFTQGTKLGGQAIQEDQGPLLRSRLGTDPGFQDRPRWDLRPRSDSPARGLANQAEVLAPKEEFGLSREGLPGSRARGRTHDSGAYEYGTAGEFCAWTDGCVL